MQKGLFFMLFLQCKVTIFVVMTMPCCRFLRLTNKMFFLLSCIYITVVVNYGIYYSFILITSLFIYFMFSSGFCLCCFVVTKLFVVLLTNLRHEKYCMIMLLLLYVDD